MDKFNLNDYADKPWELDRLPDHVFYDRGIDRESFIAGLKSAYAQKQAAYVPVNSDDKESAAKLFWKDWDSHTIDKEVFHKAFDTELLNLNALTVFDHDGNLRERKTYSNIISIYGRNPKSDAAKALLQYWKFTYANDSLDISKEASTKQLTKAVREELKKFPITAKWKIEGKLISVRPMHAEFESNKKDGSKVITCFSYDFASLTPQECAAKIVEHYYLDKYVSKKISKE